MRWTPVGVVTLLALFVGCSAAPDDSEPLEDVAAVASPAAACTGFTSAVQDHVIAGRASRTDTQFLFWTFTTYYTSGLASETIGTSATQRVTLYPKAGGYTLDPAKCVAGSCGNGVLEAPAEQCDGNLFASGDPGQPPGTELNCTAFGASPPWATGNVKCTTDCKYDMSSCKAAVCGDGLVNGAEQCDGQIPADLTCQRLTDLGVFTGGQLKCSGTCTFDTSGCTSLCGNGRLDPGEDCDGTLFTAEYAGKTCSSFQVPYPTWPFGIRVPYAGTTPLKCNPVCTVNLPGQCTMPTGCYYVIVAGGQPSAGVRCF